MAVPVDHLQGALTDGGESAVGGRHVADDDEARAQYSERRAQAGQSACKKYRRASRRSDRTFGIQLHDGRARALFVGGVIEITDQHVAAGDDAAGWELFGYESDAIRIDIAVRRHGRGIDEA